MSAMSLAELPSSKPGWATMSELLTSIVILGAVKLVIKVVNADNITVTLEALFCCCYFSYKEVLFLKLRDNARGAS
jgi:hypothetical protein